jgi:hypothetical protein
MPAFPDFHADLEHVFELPQDGPPPAIVFVDEAARVGGSQIGPSEQDRELFRDVRRGFRRHFPSMGAAAARNKRMSLPGA